MKYDEKKLKAGQRPSAQQSYVQQAGAGAGAAFRQARANQSLPSAQQNYVNQVGAAAGAAFQRARANQGLPSAQQNYVHQAGAAAGDAFRRAWLSSAQQNYVHQAGAAAGNAFRQQAAAQQGNAPTAAQNGYVSPYADNMDSLRQQMGDLADQYANRGPFQVNLANDALYKQYAQQYAQMGKRAMQDTMGQAVGLTGGYGSSYAQNVGQQAYNQQMQGLNDAALSIYDRAKARWDAEGDQMLRRLELLGNQYERERQADIDAYGRYRDQVSDDRYAEERDYNRDWQQRQWDREGQWHDQDFAHTLAREQVQDDQWEREFGRQGLWHDQEFNYNAEQDRIANDWHEREFGRQGLWHDQEFNYNAEQDRIANDWHEREFGREGQWHDQEFNYNAEQDRIANDWHEREFGREGQWHDQEFNYNTGRDTRDDGWQQAMTWLQAGIVPDAPVLQAAGISAADAQRLASYYSRANAGSYGGSSSGGRSSGRRSSSGGRSSGGRSSSGRTSTGNTAAAAAAPAAINGALAGVYVANNAGAGDKIGSDSWVDTQAKWYARLVNNHKDPQEVYDAIVGEYTQANGKLNPADITRLWGMIQNRVANAGYIRGNRNAYEGEMP